MLELGSIIFIVAICCFVIISALVNIDNIDEDEEE